MEIEDIQNNKPILVCGNYRGYNQPIRFLLFYLQVPFIEIHYNKKGEIQEKDHEKLLPQNFCLTVAQMPYLIHEEICVSQTVPILYYICRRYQRESLMGKNLKDKARVNEVLFLFLKTKVQKHRLLLEVMAKIGKEPLKGVQILKQHFKCVIQLIEYAAPLLSTYQPQKKYILEYFSVLDILCYQNVFYLVNVFGRFVLENPLMKKLMAFKKRFEDEQQWYKKHQEHLQSYKIMLNDNFPQQLYEIFRKVWGGDPKQLS